MRWVGVRRRPVGCVLLGVAGAAVAGAALLAGCSSTSTPSASPTSSTRRASTSTSEPPTTTSSTAPNTDATTSTLLPQTATSTEFVSPSGNIGCEIDSEFGAQMLTQTLCLTESPPASVVLRADGTLTECSGQACLSNAGLGTPTLHYGVSIGLGPFTCLSTESGIRCTLGNGNGFVIARSGVTPLGSATVASTGG